MRHGAPAPAGLAAPARPARHQRAVVHAGLAARDAAARRPALIALPHLHAMVVWSAISISITRSGISAPRCQLAWRRKAVCSPPSPDRSAAPVRIYV